MICSFLLNVIKTEFDMKKHSRLVERVVRPYLIFIALILAVVMIVMYLIMRQKMQGRKLRKQWLDRSTHT